MHKIILYTEATRHLAWWTEICTVEWGGGNYLSCSVQASCKWVTAINLICQSKGNELNNHGKPVLSGARCSYSFMQGVEELVYDGCQLGQHPLLPHLLDRLQRTVQDRAGPFHQFVWFPTVPPHKSTIWVVVFLSTNQSSTWIFSAPWARCVFYVIG